MKRTMTHIAGLLVVIAALQWTAVAQQSAGSTTQARPPVQRPRAAAQQPVREAAKAAKQAEKEARGLAADQPKQPKQIEQQKNRRAQQIADVYVSGLQNGVGLSNEQTRKLSPFVGNFVRRQLGLAQQKNEAKKRLQELSDQHASDQDIQTQYNQLELTQTQLENSRRQFFANINSQLTPKQRADLIQYMDRTDQDIRKLIEKSAK
ncbi:MAG TPA: hypothetical protein VK210_14305 [Terriglobia bacterium]|nr:hypothetical protein [Terriglobia bacterium]